MSLLVSLSQEAMGWSVIVAFPGHTHYLGLQYTLIVNTLGGGGVLGQLLYWM